MGIRKGGMSKHDRTQSIQSCCTALDLQRLHYHLFITTAPSPSAMVRNVGLQLICVMFNSKISLKLSFQIKKMKKRIKRVKRTKEGIGSLGLRRKWQWPPRQWWVIARNRGQGRSRRRLAKSQGCQGRQAADTRPGKARKVPVCSRGHDRANSLRWRLESESLH